MAKKITPLKEKINELSKLSLDDLNEQVEKVGITRTTFWRDQKTSGKQLPYERLHIYAGLLGCDVSELVDSFVKVKPVTTKKSILKKSGLKTA